MPDDVVNDFYSKLSNAVEDISLHSMVIIGGDMNAQISKELLPPRPRPPAKTVDAEPVVSVRKATLRASTQSVHSAQINVRKAFDCYEDKRINEILCSFETPAAASVIKTAWDLVKKLSGKKSRSTIFIEGEDRLTAWENHFKNSLKAEPATQTDGEPVVNIFDLFTAIKSGELTQAEVYIAIRQLRNGKAPGLDGLPPKFWKLKRVRKSLLKFCNETYHERRPIEWPNPNSKEGDLTKQTITEVFLFHKLQIYNRCLLNRIRPVIDEVLRPNQNGFRQGRSATFHILALRRIVEELKNHDMEAIVTFIDFRKAFDSIN
ncbi:PREDICTED: uncharacterized protein LOC106818825 [Priapulus caudatus]|uniref:Uncharacterized protein LOC106818825 n=1 Tax=Priapulus caudatus TaxID=37621 RepID=A0ABM1F3G3_PRICU|nr:PREDICTED: uncharacterized protein LOC106818825 [Priapulus caudatus]